MHTYLLLQQMDEFEIEAVDLGEVKQVIVGHDGKGAGAGWDVSKMVVQEGDKEFYFPCDR